MSTDRRQVMLGAAGVCLLGPAAAAAALKPPNIVFIMADDLGAADLSCYGRRDYATPAIDSLARDGVMLTEAYANSCVCTPTRVALMTGRYNDRLRVGIDGAIGAAAKGSAVVGLPPSHPTLPSLLRAAGYGTTLVGKWHLGYLPHFGPLKSGYDYFLGTLGGAADYFSHLDLEGEPSEQIGLFEQEAEVRRPGYLTDVLGVRAVQVIEDYARSKKPFLLSLHFTAPHSPFEGPDDAARAATLRGMADPAGGSRSTYAAMVGSLDNNVGRVLAALDRTGLAGDTIVIFTSDNGGTRFSDNWPYRGRKGDLLEGGVRVPALVRWPGRIQAGSKTDQVLLSMDWLPTLLAAAKAPPAVLAPDGENLLPQLLGAAPPQDRTVFWRHNINLPQGAVRRGRLKYLRMGERETLHDVVGDPQEDANLRSVRPEDFAELKRLYETWNSSMAPATLRMRDGAA